MFLGNVHLLIGRIAAHLDELHPVQQGPGNGLHIVGGGNKQHLGQIHRQLHIVITELVILLRIQHLQQGRCRISLVIAAHFVDLIQQHQRIFHTGAFQACDDPARHGAHVCSSVSPDLRLVPDTAQTDTDIFLIQCPGHRLGNGRLTGSRRAHQTDDGAVALAGQRPHSQEFQHPLLHLLQAIVILVQHLSGIADIGVVLGHMVPGQRQQRLNIAADHRTLGIVLSHVFKTGNLLGDLLLDILIRFQAGQLLFKMLRIRERIVLSQLLPDVL